jgi:hypothetical protein
MLNNTVMNIQVAKISLLFLSNIITGKKEMIWHIIAMQGKEAKLQLSLSCKQKASTESADARR